MTHATRRASRRGHRRRPGRPGRRRPPGRARPRLHRPGGRRRAGRRGRQWGHVRLFSPWRYNIDAAARRLLDDAGWVAPDPEVLPTGGQLVADYLQPLADLPALKPHVRYGARVAAVTRLGLDRVRTAGREDTPFLVRLADGEELLARAVIDASGTWGTPERPRRVRPPGPTAKTAAAAVPRARPARRPRRGPRPLRRQAHPRRRRGPLRRQHAAGPGRTRRAGAGHPVTWAIRAASPARTYGGEAADALPARGALGTRLREHVEAGTIELVTGFSRAGHHRQHRTAGGAVRRRPDGDRRPDRRRRPASGPTTRIAAELRLDLDPILGSTRALAPLIDPNEHSCGTVPPHGVDELDPPRARLLRRRREVLRPRADVPARHRLRAGPLRRRRPRRRLGRRPATSSSTCPRPASAPATRSSDSDTIAGTAVAAAGTRRDRPAPAGPGPGHRHRRRAAPAPRSALIAVDAGQDQAQAGGCCG